MLNIYNTQECADKVLKLHKSEQTLPVNAKLIAQKLGLKVFAAKLDRKTLGFLTEHNTLYVNTRTPDDLTSFIIMQLVGYHILDSNENNEAFILSKKAPVTINSMLVKEFACKVLMPTSSLEKLLSNNMPPSYVAEFFHVPLEIANLTKIPSL